MIGNYIKAVATAVSRTTAQLMKTGQTTSYRTGDDGDLEAGRSVSFTVLAENNPFGNTNRFTDELGTQTYTNNIVIDWSTYDGATVLGWRRTRTNNKNFDQAVDECLLVSIGTFTTGWRLPNVNELASILNFSLNGGLNYSPMNLASNTYLTSTTLAANTSQCYALTAFTAINNSAKTTNLGYIPCRTFTVTGTTLS
jgi:hypothetical protein